MKHDLTITGTIQDTKAAIKISFPEFPKVCDYINFQSNGLEINLSADELKKDALSEIAKIPAKFNCEADEFNIILEDGDLLHIATDGNHIRFSSCGNELAYWVCDELQEESETEEVLGAIAGYSASRKSLIK